MKASATENHCLKKKIKELEVENEKITDSKIYYQRNVKLKKSFIVRKKRNILEEKLKKDQRHVLELKRKIKLEKDLKNKYKKKAAAFVEEKEICLNALNTISDDRDLVLTQREG